MAKKVNPMVATNNVINELSDKQLDKTMLTLGMLADPLTRRIMAKLASKHSPIAVNDIPADKLDGPKPAIISRLCRLKSYGFVESENKIDGDEFYKVYHLNSLGKKVVETYMSTELDRFQ